MAPGDRGTVKIRAPRLTFKSATQTDVENTLVNLRAFKVVDRGPARLDVFSERAATRPPLHRAIDRAAKDA